MSKPGNPYQLQILADGSAMIQGSASRWFAIVIHRDTLAEALEELLSDLRERKGSESGLTLLPRRP